jgi:hypothetical protein
MTRPSPNSKIRFFSLGCLLLCSTLATSAAFAQDEEDPAALDEEDSLGDLDEENETEIADVEPVEEEATAEAPKDESNKGDMQLLMGMRYRGLVTPKFLINMFGVEGGRTVYVNGFGPEIGAYWGKRDDGFMLMFSPWIAYYSLKPTPFKGKNDGDEAWEIIESDMKVWYLTIDTMWDHKIIDRLSFQVGGGFGVGIVGGDLIRNEAYVTGPGDGDVPDLAPCAGPGDPMGGPIQCPADGNYGVSDRWPVYPWINFQVGLRYQPIDEFVARFEMGLGSAGFWFGLGADYSLFL